MKQKIDPEDFRFVTIRASMTPAEVLAFWRDKVGFDQLRDELKQYLRDQLTEQLALRIVGGKKSKRK